MTSSIEKKTEANLVDLPSGVKIHVDKRGDSGELVIFLHAVGLDSTSWSEQMDFLCCDYTCVSLDMRGHNRSPAPSEENIDKEIKIAHFADDVIALIGFLGYAKAHLVGLSMGGVVALETFRQRPDLVQSITMANSWSYMDDAATRIAFMEDNLKAGLLIDSSKKLIPDLFSPGVEKSVVESAIKTEGSKNKNVFMASWRSMFQVDFRDMLPKINVPLLLIGGSLDKVTPTDPLSTFMKEHVPLAQLAELKGAGHFSNLSHKDEFNQLLKIHLRRARFNTPTSLNLKEVKDEKLSGEIVAHGMMELLNKRGIRYFFSNSGTDFTPIIDAFAKFKNDSDFKIEPVVAPHENTAIAMAHGYYLMSGEPQVVMGHVNVGTANMGLGIINANRARIPVVVLSGNTPWYDSDIEGCRTNFVQWGQDTFDQASYFREFTKWDYELKGPHHIETVIDRSLAIAQSDPQGPVYLTLPKEALCMSLPETNVSDSPTQTPTSSGSPPPHMVAKAGRMIVNAKKPLIVTSELGRYPHGVEALVQLATTYAIPVIEHGKKNFFNFPTESPYHFGFEPSPYIEEADLVIAIECHVPWIPQLSGVKKPPKVIQIGVDPLCENLPMRAFPSQVNLQGSPPAVVDSLHKVLACLGASDKNSGKPFYTEKVKRDKEFSLEHDRLFKSKREAAKSQGSLDEITKDYLSYAIGEVVDDQVVIFNEYNLDPFQVKRHLVDSWFENSVASGLGWSLGAALGAQLASREETMLVTLGDGSYIFNTPLSAHYVAEAYNLPIVIVVFNDNAWSTIKKSYKGSMPEGWGLKNDYMPLTDFQATIQIEKLAESTGGVGLKVDKPEKLISTLKQAINISRQDKKHVLVNVICKRDG